MSFIIYCHTNKLNGKKYIGQTCQTINARWKQDGSGYKGCTHFYNAIKKYGWDNFEHEIIEEGLSSEEANEREEYYIQLHNTLNSDYGYNLKHGGDNGKHTEETKAKISKTALLQHDKRSARVSGELNPMYGVHLKGEANHNFGRHPSEETIEKNRIAHIGENNFWYGKTHTEETKAKMRKSAEYKAIKVICIETNTVYNSIMEAERNTGADHHGISYCCKGTRQTAGGYHWEYVNKEVA